MAALWGAGRAAGARGTRRGRGGGSGPELPPPPASPPQCFSLEEDELSLHLVPACSDAILEAEGILGTMQSYLDSSMISIIEDFGTLTENKACLDAPNELSLLTAITEILDSTDDETLSPFDTTLDSELLALPRERESSSFQKFLSLSRASPERSVPALDDPWGLSGPAAIGKVETGPVDLPWNRPLSCLEEPAAPKPRPSRAPRAERKLPRPQPLPQRSDGEEEEEAASPGQHGGVAVTGGLRESPMDLCAEAGGEEAAWPEDTDTPCIISTGAGSLSELVKSMHPYCLPTLTVCLDPASEPVAKEFLTSPLLLEIVPGEGESLEIPVVLQQLGPGAQLPAEGEGASGCLAGEGDGALEPLPTDGVVPVGMPAQGCETGGPIRAPQEEPPSPTQERESPRGVDPEAKDEARQRDQDLESSSRHSTEAPVGRKRQGTEKGRGRERARKSRKKKREESQKGQAKPDGDCAVRRLRSTSAVQPPATQRSPSRAARPSMQVSTFLEKQLEQAKKEGQMELRSARGRPRAAAAGGGLQRKGRPEVQKELEAEKPNTQPAVQSAETPGPSERAVPSPGEQPAAVGPGPAEQGEVAPGCSEGSQPAPTKGSTPPHDDLSAGGEAAGWPSKPRALSLTEYRLRMLRRQPSGADGKEGEKQAASKWPSVPEPPTELAEIPCLMAPVRPPPSQPAQPMETPSSQRGPEKPASPPATPPLARKAPAGPPKTLPAPVPPGLQLPVLPPALGAAAAVIPLASPAPYALYPPVPSWPCFGPPPASYPSLPPPPAAGGSPNAFHLVPGLPPPAVAWPTPALPPPPFGPGVPCAPMGWPLGLQPPYWPGVPLPPPVPPMVYSDPGAALQSPGANPFPGSPATLAPSCQETSAFTAQSMKPVLASQATAAAKHEVPAQPPQRGPQPSGRASDPRRQSRPVGESPAAQPVGRPPIATARTMGESTAAWPVGKSSAAQPPIVTTRTVGESVSAAAPRPVEESTTAPQPVGQSPAPRPVGQPPAQPTRELPPPPPVGEPPAQPTREAPAPRPVGEPPAQPTREPPAPWPVGEPPAQPTREPPVTRPVGEPPASRAVGESSAAQPPIATAPPVGESVSAAAPRPVGESTAAQPVRDPPAQPTRESPAPRPVGEPPDTCPRAETAAPAKVPVPSLLEGARPDPKGAVLQDPRPPGHTSIPGKAGALLRAREESQPTKPAPAQPWRHRPLISPAQPGARKDIVQAFISEIGIEASDLSSLLEQFEKTEATKEELHVRCPRDRLAPGNAGTPESHQDKNPPDSLHAPELANVAGLTPPATPPHQLWKPLAAVSLLGKPGAAPQEGSQRTAKFMEAKPLPQSKPRGKGPPPTTCGPPPSHVGSGDHDYCVRGSAQPEEGARLPGTPAPSELGSRWNVKHHQDITIKLPSSLSTRTLAWPGLSPQPGTGPGSSEQLDHRTSAQSQVAAGRSSPPTSVLLSPDASPCRDEELQTRDPQPKQLAAKRSLRCYRRRGASPSPRARTSRSFSSTSSGASASSSSSSSSSRSRSRSLSPPPKRWRRYRSRRSRSSHSSRSSCGSCGRSRGRSSSSSSSYSSRSSSASRSRSRSPSPRRRSNRRRRYDYGDPPDHCQHPKVLHKERAIGRPLPYQGSELSPPPGRERGRTPYEERRVVFIGKIPSRMTRAELRHRFSVFGDIEECTLHFRAEGDNYGFVTYRYAKEAFAAIESGHKLRRPDEQPFDLCFGGRRQFCRRNYADLDSNREDLDPAPIKSKFDSLDFDTLLKQAQRNLRR